MSILRYILRSISFYRKQHLALFAGTLISTAVLTGALIVGDSVRLSLSKLVDVRLGNIRYALITGERLVRWNLSQELGKELNAPTATLLMVQGVASNPDNASRANGIQVIGVDNDFWKLSGIEVDTPYDNEVIINNEVAKALNLTVGDEFLLRVKKLDAIPLNAPFAQDINLSIAIRVRVKTITTDNEMGRFSLKSNQAAPFNVFISNQLLAKNLELASKANVILVADKNGVDLSTVKLDSTFKKVFTIADAGLSIRELPESNRYELISERIFIDEPIAKSILNQGINDETVLTYLVNSFRLNGKETPYSFVAATTHPVVDSSINDNEIVINQWLANDLGAKVGDTLELKYFVIGPLRTLKEETNSFVVRDIIPIQSAFVNNSLMPLFPGLADAGSCYDWETGIPIDLERIRPKDEQYWNDFRGTPKALISMQQGINLWGNSFGNYTSMRFDTQNIGFEELQQQLAKSISPIDLGLAFMPIYEQGISSAKNSVDFGSLFISLSFFLIAASILLTVLTFSLNVESRREEIGILSGLGFTRSMIAGIHLGESIFTTFFGGLAGVFLGIAYTQLIIWALNSVWQGAVHTNILEVFALPSTAILGFFISVAIASLSIYLVIVRKLKQPLLSLVRSNYQELIGTFRRRSAASLTIAIVLISVSFAIVAISLSDINAINPSLFLSAGGLFLAGCIGLINWFYRVIASRNHLKPISLNQLAITNSSRSRVRSLTTIALLALGTFIIIITGANRKTFYGVENQRSSGTGGFLLWMETTLPIPYNLNTNFGKAKLGLEYDTILNSVDFIQLHRLDGDDASCLNLNQVQKPAILGVNYQTFDSLGAFSFVSYLNGVDKNRTWLELQNNYGNNTIPAIADQTVLTWGLMKSVGDTISYLNEVGDTLNLKIVAGLSNSVFQGNILISDELFRKHFPSSSGSSIMLVDAPSDYQPELIDLFNSSLVDFGVEVKPTSVRLAEFNTVENTYLTVFMVLGGLGIVIGTFGLGVVLLRNMLERSGELAVMLAMGFSKRELFRLIFTENLFLLISGLTVGTLSAAIGILPSLLSPAFSVPYGFVAILLASVFLSGVLWIFFPTRSILSRNVLKSIREE
ncbi:MAG: ABC transporter permease [Tenuifilaceae bacterium]|jgi:ABC-type antimicrobial peptide transport system permease subunit|nr:ABC transporter permease [Tenuifilaceae bacterium]